MRRSSSLVLPTNQTVIIIQFYQQFQDNLEVLKQSPEENYKIIKQIGEGGFGRVYLCKDKITHKNYAIKRISIEKPSQRERIYNEIILTKLSSSKNIVQYYESYEHGNDI